MLYYKKYLKSVSISEIFSLEPESKLMFFSSQFIEDV